MRKARTLLSQLNLLQQPTAWKPLQCLSLQDKHLNLLGGWSGRGWVDDVPNHSQDGCTHSADDGLTAASKLRGGLSWGRGYSTDAPGIGFDAQGRKTLAHPDYTHIQTMWDHHANKGKLPSDFPHKSRSKVVLRCGGCLHGCGRHHTWTARIKGLTQYPTASCPSCISSGEAFCVCQSVASIPKLLSEWHPSNPDATTVAKNSHEKFLWRCLAGKGHPNFGAPCNCRTSSNQGCPVCGAENMNKKKYPVVSEGRPDLAEQWHPTLNILKPGEVECGSHLRVWWVCTKRGHPSWSARVGNRALRGQGCPVCARMDRRAPSSTKPRIFGPFTPEQHSQWNSKL